MKFALFLPTILLIGFPVQTGNIVGTEVGNAPLGLSTNASVVGTKMVSAYTLRPQETDATPCQTALGPKVDICELAKTQQLCAANDYPLKTLLQVGDITCLVVDRLNPRYQHRIDLVMGTVEEALKWGVREMPVEVLKSIETRFETKEVQGYLLDSTIALQGKQTAIR